MSETANVSKNLVLKWVGFACLLVGIGYGVKSMSDVYNGVRLVYRMQSAPFTVEIKAADGTLVRRTEFGAPPFEHEVVLPKGRYTAYIEQSGLSFRPVGFVVDDEGPVFIDPKPVVPVPSKPEGRPPE